ncbi:beta-ketoacyl synthase [Microbulbifer yueqingensis]|uniref:Acetoacetyl-[acyl-carrier protein] synthase n=1 Tax=Microbulbifer yueqingensis TaxID=658219 RepID=A0A1G9AGU4_9GAMM|nr:beta-ketoacyl synthase [Microbulbifer yueqingensis]SDK26567.1 acetoacetyl-[acyl-carrier protein] synthase [Microbulbifer yueqingensis]
MQRLPVITAFGGFNPAGRSSFHRGYRRLVLDCLGTGERADVLSDLAALMGLRKGAKAGGPLDAALEQQVIDGTLVRELEQRFYDYRKCHYHQPAELSSSDGFTFEMAARQLPDPLPEDWQVEALGEGRVRVRCAGLSVMLDSYREIPVASAGQLPTGFEPGQEYNSRFHPRGLQLAILGASDAVQALGIDWETVVAAAGPQNISVYASSAMSQLDPYGNGGLLQSRLRGTRVSSKQLALGLTSMPADFVNAYVLGSVGTTGAVAGACATYLYNLRAAVEDIRHGRARVAVVGAAEAPLVPEVVDGYTTMGALANIDGLRKLFPGEIDYRRASRPFGENCGFTLGEGTQWAILMDDELALELGASIHGAVANVFVNADGTKKSISAPGPGNYLTVARALAETRAIVGEESLQRRSFVQAHGSSTPQNRVTESAIFDRLAGAFGIENWPVCAVKAYLGHTVSAASGDQLITSLGMFAHGILPGITTIDRVADDVHHKNLDISLEHRERAPDSIDVAFLNSKGFGGNNATASVLSPRLVEGMLSRRHGEKAMTGFRQRNEAVRDRALAYDQRAATGDLNAIYRFGEGLVDEELIEVSTDNVSLPGVAPVNLPDVNPFEDMC